MAPPIPNPEEEESKQILHDYSPFLLHYKSGRIQKLMGLDTTPPSLDPLTAVQSKDITISSPHLSARLFRPQSASPGKKLPLLVFFHGGYFLIGSAFSPLYTTHLNLIVAQSNVIAVSVDYRLAPEHPLPTAYEDSWTAVKWIGENSGSEDWIRDFADLDRVYFGGDSAGANIAHNMATRAGLEKPGGLGFNLRGMFLNSPYFWGESRIGNEAEYYKTVSNFKADDLWKYACSGSTGCDDPLIDPGMDLGISDLGVRKVLVYVGREDFLRDRGWYYKEVLEKSGWEGEVEILDFEGEDHDFHVINPSGKNSVAMFKKLGEFLNQ